MKRSKDCGCSHKAHERNGNMPKKIKKPIAKTVGGKVAKTKAGMVQLGGGGKMGA